MRCRLRSWTALAAMSLLTLVPATLSAQCVEVRDGKDAPPKPKSAAWNYNSEADVPQVIRLTASGRQAIGAYSFGYVEITREPGDDRVDGTTVFRDREVFIRLIDTKTGETPFTFSREGAHTIRLFGAHEYKWPDAPDLTTAAAGTNPNIALLCNGQPRTINVGPPQRRPDFPGIRGQWWIAYRFAVRPELGTAVFFKRLGLAVAIEDNVLAEIGDPHDPSNVNPVTGTAEVRIRGSRGYIAGGIRYYPESEPDKHKVRPGVFFGEELPTWKGRRLWLLVDITLQQPKKDVISGLRLGLGARLDLWGSKP